MGWFTPIPTARDVKVGGRRRDRRPGSRSGRTWLASYLCSVRTMFSKIRFLLTPKYLYGSQDPALQWCERIRTVATVVFLIYISLRYTGVSYDRLNEILWLSPTSNAAIALPVVLVAMVVLLATSEPEERGKVLRALRRPFMTVVAIIGFWLAFVATFYEFTHARTQGWYTSVMYPIIALALLLYGIPAFAWATFLCVRNWFNAADGHPMLPAMSAVLFALVQLGINTYLIVTAQLNPLLPTWLAAVAAVSSPVVLGTAAAIEIILLHRRGVSLRRRPNVASSL